MEVVFTRNRQIISNKFWYFRFGIGQNDTREDPGITERWFESGIPSGPEKLKVYVPSTWSMFENRKTFYHFGTGWYETSFFIPESWGEGDGSEVDISF